jgi:hypothetical protein
MAEEYTENDRMRDYQELFNRINMAAGGLIYDKNTGNLDWKRVNTVIDKGLGDALIGLCADEDGKRCIKAFMKLKEKDCIDPYGQCNGVRALHEGLGNELKLLYSPRAIEAWHNDLMLEPFLDENGDLNLVEAVGAGITDISVYADFGVTQAEIDKCIELNKKDK